MTKAEFLTSTAHPPASRGPWRLPPTYAEVHAAWVKRAERGFDQVVMHPKPAFPENYRCPEGL